MRSSLLLLLMAASAIASPQIIAYYYPWYIEGDWSRHGYVGTPKLGKYGTDSPEIAKTHIDWAADAGIDGFFVSWWGPKHLADKHLQAGLLQAPNLSRIRFALYYECLGLLDDKDGKRDGVIDFAKPEVLAAFIRDLQQLDARYFGHPQYLRVDGKALVGLYVTRTFRNFSNQHLEQLRSAVKTPLYLVADEAFLGPQAKPESARNQVAFDAWSAYNMFENALVRDNDTALSYQSREAFPIFRQWAASTAFIPGVFPSYADFRGHKPLPGTPADFATLLDAASSIGSAAAPMILVTSFNEWWEGTTIEPAEEYQDGYLQVIKAFTDR
jgi:glycoprotein endo-alpha-1,2-mannosidase